MATTSYGKSFGVFLFYGVVVALLAWLGFHFSRMVVNVSSEVGAFIGSAIGLVAVVLLYMYFGKKYIESS